MDRGRPGAPVLARLPWELARVNGRTLAAHHTNLVVVPESHAASNHHADDKRAVGKLNTMGHAQSRETEQHLGTWLVRAARSSAPYLLRRRRWHDLAVAASALMTRDARVETGAALLPVLDVARDATRGGDLELIVGRTHAQAVARLDRAHAKELMRGLLSVARARACHQEASYLAGDLAHLLTDEGNYPGALVLVEKKIDYSRRAGAGPWTALLDQVLLL